VEEVLLFNKFFPIVDTCPTKLCDVAQMVAGRTSTIVYILIFPAFDEDGIDIRSFFVKIEKLKVKVV